MGELSLVYYGYVFDASGYGQAARAYIHALHEAGVGLSVVNLSGNGRQVQDPLIESLLGRPVDPDFHLFHGIPPHWARLAFRLPNAIGMTVWETDTMPSQWRNVLNHTLEVWLPCEFNVSVFSRALETPAFKLPHPVFPCRGIGKGDDRRRKFQAGDSDFVFYSIFEWQDRKCPGGTIESFLRAFPREVEPLLIIKTNPGAAAVARQTLEDLRRTNSGARVQIHAEGWDESQIDALHERGNCYVSLHRGEGWGYPLFEAAGRGTPVIATEYSGPTEYLSPGAHKLVRFTLGPVSQRYAYYHPNMRWAEPDLEHASQLMREVFEQPDRARQQAAAAGAAIKAAFSLESVGRVARSRLLQLLRRTQPAKWQRLGRAQIAANAQSGGPIEPSWYDQDYFETGLKSNWEQGYSWTQFGGLFRDTAAYLTGSFPGAESFLDAGCAKGFLVRALREAGKECWGLDHSTWAIEHAEPSIQQFIFETGVDNATFDRQFDVLVAQSLLESLTEDQALSFLSRARGWTRQAMLAIIACREDNEKQTGDFDGSHITMRPRSWWHELIIRAGWRQDHLHRVVERACQTHPLAANMGWQVFVYSPGS